MNAAAATESMKDMLYNAFRRALGAWIVTNKVTGATRFEIGEWADSGVAVNPWGDETATYVGWIAGTDLGGSGPIGEDAIVTAVEFAEFILSDGFVAWGSPEAMALAEAFDAETIARNADVLTGVKIVKVAR